ncbi:MAG TPA: hypothetical protein DDW27_04710, partial [Bacteroidales bacterium]|nr:hypothetical protein [Bacteroidales bacterium]
MQNQKFILIVTFLCLSVVYSYSQAKEDKKPREIIVFKYDKTQSDFGYRIPALVTTKSGTLLAFAERRTGMSDHAQN